MGDVSASGLLAFKTVSSTSDVVLTPWSVAEDESAALSSFNGAAICGSPSSAAGELGISPPLTRNPTSHDVGYMLQCSITLFSQFYIGVKGTVYSGCGPCSRPISLGMATSPQWPPCAAGSVIGSPVPGCVAAPP